MAETIPDLNPEMLRLRQELSGRGIGYEVDDTYDRFESGLELHRESTAFNGITVVFIWTRDADERKKYDSLGGKFNYLEAQMPDGRHVAATVEEILEAAC